jgi:phage internal scaffolding protein
MAKQNATPDKTGKVNLYKPHKRVQLHFTKPSRVKREFRNDADINTIMDRFKKTGVLPVTGQTPTYMDTTQIPNLQQAMDVMIQAEAAFSGLPAKVRKEFDNNPMTFVEYATKKENLPQLREWGLAKPEEKEKPPMKVEVINKEPKDTPPAGDNPKA